MAASPIFFFLIYCFIVACCIASILCLTVILRSISTSERKDNLKFSIMLKYYFWILLVMSTLLLIHSLTVLIIWRDDLNLPYTPFFWTGTFDSAFMTVIPFTSFMLTLDRCLILILKGKYNNICIIIILCTSILINIVTAGVNLVMCIISYLPAKPKECIAYGCTLLASARLTYTYSRMTGVILSTIVGILFLITTAWLKKNNPHIGSRGKMIAETVILRAVIFGFIFDFIPHVVDNVSVSLVGESLFQYVGPYSRIIMATDLFLTSGTNRLIFLKTKKKFKQVRVSTIKNTPSVK